MDGERRFRAAQNLNLKEVPVIILKQQPDLDRMVQQFHIQEMHEKWSPIERAMAIAKLADEFNLKVKDICRLLNMEIRLVGKNISFAKLQNRDEFVRRNISIDWADRIVSMKAKVNRLVKNELNESFTDTDLKNLENKIISRISTGDLKDKNDLANLGDSFKQDPKNIKRFMTTDTPMMKLYADSGARSAYELRNTTNSAIWLKSHGNRFLEFKDTKIGPDTIKALKECMETCEAILELAE